MTRTQTRTRKTVNVETGVMDNEIVQKLEADIPVMVENDLQDLSSDDLLASAREEIRSEIPSKPEPEVDEVGKRTEQTEQKDKPKDELPSPTAMALMEAANEVIQADGNAKLARIQLGIEQGIKEVEDITTGREIGRLLALAKSTPIEIDQLSEQMRQLRSHTDIQTSSVVEQALLGMGFNLSGVPSMGENRNPLSGTLIAGLLPSRSTAPAYQLCATE